MDHLTLQNLVRTHDWTADYTAALIQRLDLVKELMVIPMSVVHEMLEPMTMYQRTAAISAINTFMKVRSK